MFNFSCMSILKKNRIYKTYIFFNQSYNYYAIGIILNNFNLFIISDLNTLF